MDPFLNLTEVVKLQPLCTLLGVKTQGYGSPEDEDAAVKSLSAIDSDDKKIRELAISLFMTKYAKLSEVICLNCIKKNYFLNYFLLQV